MLRVLRHLVLAITLCASSALAHDTWVETNSPLIRTGDAVYIDLRLGNHGNDHRDFKLANKIDVESCTLEIIAPDGRSYDLKPSLVDTGYAPSEGYWNAKFVAAAPGRYLVAHQLDKIVKHGRAIRAIKSGKTYFAVSDRLDEVEPARSGLEGPLGHPLELVLSADSIGPLGPGKSIDVQLLFKGEPLPDTRISFIPRRQALKEGFDEQYERMTDSQGRASFTPRTGDQYLVVAHHAPDDEPGEGYERTAYSATLTVFVSELCSCCTE